MAAPLQFCMSRSTLMSQVLRSRLLPALLFKPQNDMCERSFSHSSKKNKSKPPDVCLSSDKSMVMCWHPEPDFPYEHTQPLPRDKSELEEGESVLKVQYLIDEKLKNRLDGPSVNELCELFYANKEDFKRRPRHEKKIDQVKYVPKDRDGL